MTDYYKTHDSDVIHKLDSLLVSDKTFDLILQTGSRFVVSIFVASGEVSLKVENGYSAHVPFVELQGRDLKDPNALTAGHHKFVFTDFHKLFKLTLIPNGSASCALGIAVHDNAIANVSVVDDDSMLEVNSDGSINVRLTNNNLIPQIVKD